MLDNVGKNGENGESRAILEQPGGWATAREQGRGFLAVKLRQLPPGKPRINQDQTKNNQEQNQETKPRQTKNKPRNTKNKPRKCRKRKEEEQKEEAKTETCKTHAEKCRNTCRQMVNTCQQTCTDKYRRMPYDGRLRMDVWVLVPLSVDRKFCWYFVYSFWTWIWGSLSANRQLCHRFVSNFACLGSAGDHPTFRKLTPRRPLNWGHI